MAETSVAVPTDPPAPVWVLADDRAGNVAQCLGVAEMLGLSFTVKPIRYGRLARLPNALRGASLVGVAAASRAGLVPPWPRLVIAAGRRTAPVARWLKRRAGAALVQIMWPGAAGAAEFDLIAVPGHDRAPPPLGNILRITGAPHRASAERIAAEAARWRDRFLGLPRPWIAVLVGGTSKSWRFSPAMAVELGRGVAAMAGAEGGALLVTTSRRTGAAAEAALRQAIDVPCHFHGWGGDDNPYFAYLGLADAIVVTGDSISMACEACAGGQPVYVFAPTGAVAPKHARFHAELYGRGLARPLGPGLERWRHPPFNPAAEIAQAIRDRIAAPSS